MTFLDQSLKFGEVAKSLLDEAIGLAVDYHRSISEGRDLVSLVKTVGFYGGLPVVARRSDPGCLFVVTSLRPGDPEGSCMAGPEDPRIGIAPVSGSSEEFPVVGAEKWIIVSHDNSDAWYLLRKDWRLVGWKKDSRRGFPKNLDSL